MIFEHARLSITPGREADFEAAFAAAPAIFAQAQGSEGIELRHCVEEPGSYLLIARWATLEDHTVGFRESPLFAEWRGLVSEFFAAPPDVRHFSVVA